MTRLPSTKDDRVLETRILAWSASIVALFFMGLGIGFWLHTKQSITTCVFGHPDCSTAAATWALLIATACAFIAAYEAAMRAGQALTVSQNALIVSQAALSVETEPALGQWICTCDGHKVPKVVVFIEDQICSVGKPRKYSQNLFLAMDYEFENLGRNALRDVTVTLYLRWETENVTQEQTIQLGSIGANRDAHVSVNLLWDSATRPRIGWLPEATIMVPSSEIAGTLQVEKIPYSPYPLIQVEGNEGSPPTSHTASAHLHKSVGPRGEARKSPEPPPDDARWLYEPIDIEASKKAPDGRKLQPSAGKQSADPGKIPEEAVTE